MPTLEPLPNADKAGKAHWDQTERNAGLVIERFAPTPGLRGFARRQWHAMFRRAFPGDMRGRRLLELGCGGSAFLPYFAHEFGFAVSGIDYSEGGCRQTRELCASHGVQADIVCADFFNAPPSLHGAFDAVVSFGVVEHFSDTAATVGHFARFLRPGGTLLTMVPNMHGAVGLSQRWLNRDVFDKHEQIDPARLHAAHEHAGLAVRECGYFLFCNFGVVNVGGDAGVARRNAFRALQAATGAVWAVETLAGSPSPRRGLSPYVLCIADAPGG
jgi:SAM-dependent methyltransferase